MIRAKWNVKLTVPDSVDIWIDYYDPVMVKPRIVMLAEPYGKLNDLILRKPTGYIYLFTYFDILLHLPNVVFHQPAGSFVGPDPDIKKKFCISNVITNRANNAMHYVRRELWARKDEIQIPKDFYTSSRNPHPDRSDLILGYDAKSKIQMFDCMFHICILTSNQRNYIDEKLIDCLITKTIPVFIGCENIGDFFNVEGMIICNSVNDMIQKCNNLKESDYYNRMPAIEDNYIRAMKYIPYEKVWSDKINKLL